MPKDIIGEYILPGLVLCCTAFIVLGLPMIILEQDRVSDLKSHDRYLMYKHLRDQRRTIRQMVVKEEQLLTLSPIHLMRLEIAPATENTVVLKGEARLLAMIYDELYRADIKKHEDWERAEND